MKINTHTFFKIIIKNYKLHCSEEETSSLSEKLHLSTKLHGVAFRKTVFLTLQWWGDLNCNYWPGRRGLHL